MIVNAQTLLASRDCAWPGCVQDAAGTRRFCVAHQAPTPQEDDLLLRSFKHPKCRDCPNPVARRGSLCRACNAIEQANSMREHELRCRACEQWLPDDAYSFDSPRRVFRRGRKASCRECKRVRRRELAAPSTYRRVR